MSFILFKLASAIACREGYFDPGPDCVPANFYNPGDLDYEGQAGAAGCQVGPHLFARWPTAAGGIVGLYRDLLAKAAQGMTVRQIIYVFAPPSENDTPEYLADVCRWCGFANPDVSVLSLVEPLEDPRKVAL